MRGRQQRLPDPRQGRDARRKIGVALMLPFSEWQNFFVVVGAAAGSLIGLQFVVLTLIADRPVPRMAQATAAFSTPTITHLMTVLLLAAVACVPWHDIRSAATVWGLVGLAGVFFALLPFTAHVLLVA